jgi:hypothetical protein
MICAEQQVDDPLFLDEYRNQPGTSTSTHDNISSCSPLSRSRHLKQGRLTSFIVNPKPATSVVTSLSSDKNEKLKTDEVDLQKKSVVWKFLLNQPHDENSLIKICKICGTKINTSNNTTNARSHLAKKHPAEFQKAICPDSTSSSSDEAEEVGNNVTSEVQQTCFFVHRHLYCALPLSFLFCASFQKAQLKSRKVCDVPNSTLASSPVAQVSL